MTNVDSPARAVSTPERILADWITPFKFRAARRLSDWLHRSSSFGPNAAWTVSCGLHLAFMPSFSANFALATFTKSGFLVNHGRPSAQACPSHPKSGRESTLTFGRAFAR